MRFEERVESNAPQHDNGVQYAEYIIKEISTAPDRLRKADLRTGRKTAPDFILPYCFSSYVHKRKNVRNTSSVREFEASTEN